MKDGKLSNREKQALWSAYKTLDAWVDWQDENWPEEDYLSTKDDAYYAACSAVERLREFLSWIDD